MEYLGIDNDSGILNAANEYLRNYDINFNLMNSDFLEKNELSNKFEHNSVTASFWKLFS